MRTIDASSFESAVLDSEKPVLVKFSAPWCATCKQLTPVLSTLETSTGGDWSFVEVDVEEAPALAARLRVLALPTIVTYRNGEQTNRLSGKITSAQLAELVND